MVLETKHSDTFYAHSVRVKQAETGHGDSALGEI